jgi:uncharacterized protein YjbJ (UPF0337 family)
MGKGADEMSRKDEYYASLSDQDALLDKDLEAADGDNHLEAADDAEPEQQVVEIRESIEQTRAQMSETIDELQERLSPSHLKEEVKEQVKEQYEQVKETVREATIGKVENMVERLGDTVNDTRRSLVDMIKANPIPATLIGVGLAWMWMNRGSASSGESARYDNRYRRGGLYGGLYDEGQRRYAGSESFGNDQRSTAGVWDRTTDAASHLAGKMGSTMSSAVGQVQETAGDLASRAKDTVSGVVDQAQETAGYLVDQAQYQAQRVEDRFKVAMRESPLAVGAVALALGAAAGLAIPQTRKENEWMGEARDTLVDKAQSVAHDAIEQVQQVAQKVTDEVAGSGNQSPQGQPAGQGGQQASQASQSGGGNQQNLQGGSGSTGR